MSEWQDISTAPKNGFFLVCSLSGWTGDDWDTTVAAVHMRSDGSFCAYMDETGEEHPYLDGPATHWMPLPPPPTHANVDEVRG